MRLVDNGTLEAPIEPFLSTGNSSYAPRGLPGGPSLAAPLLVTLHCPVIFRVEAARHSASHPFPNCVAVRRESHSFIYKQKVVVSGEKRRVTSFPFLLDSRVAALQKMCGVGGGGIRSIT